jgi:hypothetical protein
MAPISRFLLLPLAQVATAKVWLGMLCMKFPTTDLQLTIITAGVNIGNTMDPYFYSLGRKYAYFY